jgi:hypothetical protein
MKKILTPLFVLLSISLFAQISEDQIKTGLAGKEWKITKYEVFGVIDAPKAEQVKDKIVLKSDMSFIIVENGKEYKGKWSIMNPVMYINCKSSIGSWSKTYKVISVGPKESVIEYKDPDLIKTKYYLESL